MGTYSCSEAEARSQEARWDFERQERERIAQENAAKVKVKNDLKLAEGKVVTVWVTSNKKNPTKILEVYQNKSDADGACEGNDDLLVNHEQALLYPDSTVYILKNTKRLKAL